MLIDVVVAIDYGGYAVKNKGILLDSSAKDFEVQIYEVDGIRGTLKELSDYFNVDPISVSDCMLDGMSIQDALCVAKPGFKPVEKESKVVKGKSGKKKGRKGGALAPIKGKKQAIIDEYYNTNADYKALAAKYGVSTWMIGEVLREFKRNNPNNIPKKDIYFGRRVNKPEVKEVKPTNVKVNTVVGKGKVLSTSSVSDTQDLGDLLVITTTTTVVYRKE